MAQDDSVGHNRRAITAIGLVTALVRSKKRPSGRPDGVILQFIMDWNRQGSERKIILGGELPDGTDRDCRAKAAAVIRALCERDGLETPRWAVGCRAKSDIVLFGIPSGTSYAQYIKQRSHHICEDYKVWFLPDTLDRTY